MSLSEIDREGILAARLEEKEARDEGRKLAEMLKQNVSKSASGNADGNVSTAAKRAHKVRGATKEKDKKLGELKARRKAKEEKKRVPVECLLLFYFYANIYMCSAKMTLKLPALVTANAPRHPKTWTCQMTRTRMGRLVKPSWRTRKTHDA
jgi:hypothetical protein